MNKRPDKLCVSIQEAAALLDVHRNTLRKLLQERRLATVLVGKRYKIAKVEIDRYIRDNTVPCKLIHYRKKA